jgi:hypothetical protein
MTFLDLAHDAADRLIRIFTRGPNGDRPVYGRIDRFQNDPHWRDLILFYEYFHGDNGAGLGASHQTGWTALVATLIEEWRQNKSAPAQRPATTAKSKNGKSKTARAPRTKVDTKAARRRISPR